MSLNKSKALRTAEKYVLQGKVPAAIEEYRKVVDADPSDLTTINTLGDLYVRAGRIQDAIANFSRIAESYREGGFTLKAIAMLKKISKLDPTNIDTAMKLANLYSQQGLLVEARQQYLQVADSYARAGQTRKALDAYQKIADLDPANTSVRMKLGEIYSREGMMEPAHDAFLTAGIEFLRKGDAEQALNANLKAISINPDSCQALAAIATIYTQQGMADRAINLLCDAFEKNPGDVELLTILGRTYLAADLMDDAERTFLSLVELDRNRYHYLMEVGRRFLHLGELDRAAEQIDGCLDVLITKREEDKAIDFLRRVLDKDMNHLGALRRLSHIFLRIREDHNLIATLNSLAEAAMRQGSDEVAIEALKELAKLEPDEPIHLQRLYNLGVRDISEGDSPDMVRPTGPLDYERVAYDDALVIRQISEAEILAGHGQVEQAVGILREILSRTPENVQVHLKLKDIYLRAGVMDKAATECLELARIHEVRGEAARASDYLSEARQLNPLIEIPDAAAARPDADWYGGGYEANFAVAEEAVMSPADNGFALTRSGALEMPSHFARTGFVSEGHLADAGLPAFSYDAPLMDKPGLEGPAAPAAEPAPLTEERLRALNDELEGVDFYIAQGYVEIARDTLDRLRVDYGDHPEVVARLAELGVSVEARGDEGAAGPAALAGDSSMYDWGGTPAGNGGPAAAEMMFTADPQDYGPPAANDFTLTVPQSPRRGEHRNALPLLIDTESGPLHSDLMVRLDTSELLNPPPEPMKPSTAPPNTPLSEFMEPPPANVQADFSTGSLIDSMMSDMNLDPGDPAPPEPAVSAVPTYHDMGAGYDLPPPEALPPVVEPPAPVAPPPAVEPSPATEADALVDDLQDIFDELRQDTDDLHPVMDYETSYNLGLAYKDMDLLDDAIEQFQMAFRAASVEDTGGNTIQCCHMLGVCFMRKGLPKVAVMWFQRGLNVPGRTEDEYQALRFEVAAAYEEMGDLDKAMDMYMEVYGIDVNYRGVSHKLKQLQASRNVN